MPNFGLLLFCGSSSVALIIRSRSEWKILVAFAFRWCVFFENPDEFISVLLCLRCSPHSVVVFGFSSAFHCLPIQLPRQRLHSVRSFISVREWIAPFPFLPVEFEWMCSTILVDLIRKVKAVESVPINIKTALKASEILITFVLFSFPFYCRWSNRRFEKQHIVIAFGYANRQCHRWRVRPGMYPNPFILISFHSIWYYIHRIVSQPQSNWIEGITK